MGSDSRFPGLLLVFALFVIGVFGYRYYAYVMAHNFVLDVNTSCDPSKEECFVSDCSPENDISCPPGPYKKIEISDSDAPTCLEEHTCTDFTCNGIASCTATYCSDQNLEDGESCASTASSTESAMTATTSDSGGASAPQ